MAETHRKFDAEGERDFQPLTVTTRAVWPVR
jgi:hypothetical protein